MKTILVDAVFTLVSEEGVVNKQIQSILDKYPNNKIVVTNADDPQMQTYGLDKVPYEVFTLKHNPEKTDPKYFKIILEKYDLKPDEVIYFEHNKEAVDSAVSVGIRTYFYEHTKQDLEALKNFLDRNVND